MQDYQQLLTLGTSLYAVAQNEQMGLAGLPPRVSVRPVMPHGIGPNVSRPQSNSSAPSNCKQRLGACER